MTNTKGLLFFGFMLLFLGICLAIDWAFKAYCRWRDLEDRRISDFELNKQRITVDLRRRK